MAKASFELIGTIRTTANRIQNSNDYQWGHMGSCNCGFLGQEVTRLTKAEIHTRAMQRFGDWNEQLNDYCPTSGLPFDEVIRNLLNLGFDIDDLKHLEKLSDPAVRSHISEKNLRHNYRDHVVLYMNTWANLLEEKLLKDIRIPAFQEETVTA